MTFVDALPAVNAVLNATAGVFLFLGWRAIKARPPRIERHRILMLAAVATSTLFLVFYLTRFALTGAHRYPVADWTRGVYYVVLFSHMVLAAAVVPMVLRSLWLGLRRQDDRHRRIARWTFPVWAYVSVTGVLVYLMLYHLAPLRVAGG